MSEKLVKVERSGKFQIGYVTDNGMISAFRCHPAFADFIMKAWEKRDACGFTLAQTPKGKESVIYVVPTTDGITLMVQPKIPLKIIHAEKDASNESIVQITLEDSE